MRYRQLILEYSHEKTLERFHDALLKAYKSGAREGAGLRSLGFFDLGTDDIGEVIVLFFESMDPTKKKAYVLLMIKWFLDGSMKLLEDAAKLKPAIRLVDRFRNTLVDVNFKTMSFDQFLDLGDELAKKISNSEASRAEEEYFYNDGQALKFYDGPDMKIIKPVTVAAAKYFGRGTRWCTASEDDNMFTYYARQGEIYCILFKGENRRWQFHFETEQFMDEQDKPLDETSELFLNVMGHFQHEIENRLWPHVKNRMGSPALKFLIDPPRELLLDLVEEDGDNIKFIKRIDRDDEIWFAALTNTWEALTHAQGNPAENIGLFAIGKNPNAIKYITAPTVNEQVAAVSQDAEIVYIMQREGAKVSPEAAAIVIKDSPRYIRYCGDQPVELQIAAFDADRACLQDIENPKPELIKHALEQNGRNLIYIPKHLWTDEYKIMALRNNPSVINFLHNPSPEILKAAGLPAR